MEPLPTPYPADGPLRVLVVESDRRVRQSLCGLIELADDLQVTCATADPVTALAGLDEPGVDVVVMDPRLPEVEAGRALVRTIAQRWPEVAIVALYWPEEPGGDGVPETLTVLPSAVSPDSLVDLLRSAASRTHRARAGRLS